MTTLCQRTWAARPMVLVAVVLLAGPPAACRGQASGLAEGLRERPPAGTPLPEPSAQPAPAGRGGPLPVLRQSAAGAVGSLLIVLGAFYLVLHTMTRRKRGSQSSQRALQWLGRWHLAGKHQLHLVRIGSRLLLLSAAADSVRCLAEIADPDEVQSVLRECAPDGGPLPAELARLADLENGPMQLGR